MDETTLENIVETNYHLTFAHPLLAHELVKKKILKRQKCADVSQIAYLEEYRFDLNSLKNSITGLPFEILYVKQTNMVLLIVRVNFQSSDGKRKAVEYRLGILYPKWLGLRVIRTEYFYIFFHKMGHVVDTT